MGCGSKAKKTIKKAGKDIEKTSKTIGEQATKAATAIGATAADPGAWLAYAVNPTVGLGMGGQKAEQTYEALSTAEKEAANAEASQKMAEATEKKAMAEQKKMVSDKAKDAAAKAKERATRIGQGRRGLLYQGKEAGVTVKSKVLGG